MDIADQLRKLQELRTEGIIEDDEFKRAKAILLGGGQPNDAAPIAKSSEPERTFTPPQFKRSRSGWTWTALVLAVLAFGAYIYQAVKPQHPEPEQSASQELPKFYGEWYLDATEVAGVKKSPPDSLLAEVHIGPFLGDVASCVAYSKDGAIRADRKKSLTQRMLQGSPAMFAGVLTLQPGLQKNVLSVRCSHFLFGPVEPGANRPTFSALYRIGSDTVEVCIELERPKSTSSPSVDTSNIAYESLPDGQAPKEPVEFSTAPPNRRIIYSFRRVQASPRPAPALSMAELAGDYGSSAIVALHLDASGSGRQTALGSTQDITWRLKDGEVEIDSTDLIGNRQTHAFRVHNGSLVDEEIGILEKH